MEYKAKKQQRKAQKGFTLVEMSIVLVIIGLIISGILVGQDMIQNARVGATVQQIQKYDTAYNTFNGKYNSIPGDIVKASAFLGTAYASGDGDGVIDDAADDGNQDAFDGEVGSVWDHLEAANMVDGTFTADSAVAGTGYPITKLKKSGISLGANTGGDNYWIIGVSDGLANATGSGISPAEAYGIDAKLDDGVPSSGSIMLVDDMATSSAFGTAASNDGCEVSGDYALATLDANDCTIAVGVTG